jgi:hypothetical protein
MRHRLVIASALLLALSGCSDDSPAPKTSPSTTPATASPSPTGPVAPALPTAAKANTSVGAKAFVQYWFEALNYALHSGDTSAMDALAHSECSTCAGLRKSVRRIYDADGRLVGGGWRPDKVEHDPRIDPPDYRFAVRVTQARQKVVDGSGKVIENDPRQVFVFFVVARWDGTQFLLYGVERIDD